MAQLPYVGSKINLISHSEIRYEGTLAEIDKEKQTVSLVNVRSFGTEGRRTDLFIKPKPTPFAKIVFRGQDIKDLNVQQASAAEDPAFHDPAILAHEEVRPEPEAAPAAAAAGAAGAKSLAEVKQAKAQAQRKKKEEQQQATAAAAKAAAASAPEQKPDANIAVKTPANAEEWAARTAGGRFHPTRLNTRWKPDEKQQQQLLQQQMMEQQQQQLLLQQQQQLRQRPSTGSFVRGVRGPPVNPADANIDIAATSAALEKEKQKLLEQTPAVADVTPAYNPSSFFDNLGASSASRLASSGAATTAAVQPQAHVRRQNENALNRETFGATDQPQPQVRQQQVPQQTRRYPQQPPVHVQQPYYNNNRVVPGSHGNRYGGHNRTGHHTFQRSQSQTGPRPGPRY
jgi:hypothetical protein